VADAAATATANSNGDGAVGVPDDAPYDAGYPDAADANRPPPVYLLTADTVLDPSSHLMWQRNEPGQFFDHPPTEYCAGLGLAGFNDWRPATLTELNTLLFMQPECPMLDHAAFPGALCDWYMSGDIISGDVYAAEMLDFASGVHKNVKDVASAYFSSRCVRTSP
jgi:hypothetical protein